MMDQVGKVLCIAVIASLSALAIKRYVPELALVLVLTASACALFVMLGGAAQIVTQAQRLVDYTGLDDALVSSVAKIAAIGIVSRLMGQVCKDAGEGTLALCCEIAGTFGALALTLPLMGKMLDLIGQVMG